MKTSKNELLSAWLDGESGEFERRRLNDELSHDDKLAQAMGRYALAGELIRSQARTVIPDSNSFLEGIHTRLENEPPYNEVVVRLDKPAAVTTVTVPPKERNWLRQGMGYAVAASVAVAAVTGVLLLQDKPLTEPQLLSTAESVSAENSRITPPGDELQMPESQGAVMAVRGNTDFEAQEAESPGRSAANPYLDRQTRDILKQYVTLHMQHRSNNGIVPSIQAVSYAE